MHPDEIQQLLRSAVTRLSEQPASPDGRSAMRVTDATVPVIAAGRERQTGSGRYTSPHLPHSGLSANSAEPDRRNPVASLTLGMPGVPLSCWERWAGCRLCWWPYGIPSGRRISVISSRLGRQLDQHSTWFAALRTTLLRLQPDTDVVCTVDMPGMSPTHVSQIVHLAAEMFCVPRLRMRVDDRGMSPNRGRASDSLSSVEQLTDWLSTAIHAPVSAGKTSEFVCIVSPPLVSWNCLHDSVFADDRQAESRTSPTDAGSAQAAGWSDAEHHDLQNALQAEPLADRLCMIMAQRLSVLNVRRGGHVESLMNLHLADPDRQTTLIHRFADITLTNDDNAGQMIPGCELTGAAEIPERTGQLPPERQANSRVIPFYLFPTDDDPFCSAESRESSLADAQPAPGFPNALGSLGGTVSDQLCDGRPAAEEPLSSPISQPEDWLLHWTRSRKGPWPGQPYDDWLSELVLGCESANRSALAVLLRILHDRRILASREAIRGQFDVVGFTEVPLTDFRRLRRFQAHRHRYDFEPWGVAIRREALIRMGAQRVLYGSDDTWCELSDEARPWFQKRQDDADENARFEVEREWRILGDVDLSFCASHEVVGFVDTEPAAHWLRQQTTFSILTVP